MNENKGNYEIDALQIVSMLLKKWWVIALAAILGAWLAFGYTEFFVTPTYKSTATLLINGESSISSAYQQILAGQYQSKDYPYILKANDTLSEVAEELNSQYSGTDAAAPQYTAGKIAGMISSEAVEESRIFRITVTGTNPEEAKNIAAAVTKVFISRAEDITNAEVEVVDNPVIPRSPSSSGLSRNLLLGFAIGLIIGVAYAIIAGMINDTLDSEEWLLQKYKDKIPLIAVVPDSNYDHKSSYYKYGYGYSYERSGNEASENK